MAKQDASAEMLLRNVRLSFPALWQPQRSPNPEADKGKKPTYGAHLIVEDSSQREAIKRLLGQLAFQAWGDNAQQMLGSLVSQGRVSFKDGNTKTDANGQPLDGYAGYWFCSARSTARPTVVNGDRTPLTEADGKPYSGCYVNAKVRFWVQQGGQYGRRINCQLQGVQFAKDGEAFGGGRVASPDEFDTLDEFADQGAPSMPAGGDMWDAPAAAGGSDLLG